MSIAASSIGAEPVASQNRAVSATSAKPPRKRQIVAKTDSVTDPEAR